MKFCPECGSVRDGKDICECGYNYLTGEVDEKIRKEVSQPTGPTPIGIFMGIPTQPSQNNYGGIPLEELKKRKVDMGDLKSVSFVSSGGMMGSFYSYSLSFLNNELEITLKEWHHGPKTKKVYKVDLKKSKEIKDLLIENNFRAWSEVPVDQSLVMFDTPTSSLTLVFESDSVMIPTKIYMTKEEMDIYNHFGELINALKDDKNLLSDEVVEEGQSMVPYEA